MLYKCYNLFINKFVYCITQSDILFNLKKVSRCNLQFSQQVLRQIVSYKILNDFPELKLYLSFMYCIFRIKIVLKLF